MATCSEACHLILKTKTHPKKEDVDCNDDGNDDEGSVDNYDDNDGGNDDDGSDHVDNSNGDEEAVELEKEERRGKSCRLRHVETIH